MLSPRCCCLSSEQNFNPTCGFFILWYVHTCTPYLLTILKDKYVQVIMLVFYKLSSGIFWFQKWERKIQTNLELPENGIICGWKINHFWGHVLLKSRHLQPLRGVFKPCLPNRIYSCRYLVWSVFLSISESPPWKGYLLCFKLALPEYFPKCYSYESQNQRLPWVFTTSTSGKWWSCSSDIIIWHKLFWRHIISGLNATLCIWIPAVY